MTAASEHADFFYTPALKGLMQQLVHLATFGDGFSVVLGGKGAGKTTVSLEVQKHFDGAQELVRVALDEPLELAESLVLLADAFGLPQGDELSVGELLSELRHYVQSLAQDKKLLVLIVDNAHHFDDQAVGALVSLLQGGAESNFGLHLILFSLPGLEARIDRLQILDIAVYDFEIPNYSPTELSSFLESRNTSVQHLTTSQIQKIWSLSKGFPGPALLALSGCDSPEDVKEESSKNKIPMGHIAAVILLACVLFWSISWHTGKTDQDDTVSKDLLVKEEYKKENALSVGARANVDSKSSADRQLENENSEAQAPMAHEARKVESAASDVESEHQDKLSEDIRDEGVADSASASPVQLSDGVRRADTTNASATSAVASNNASDNAVDNNDAIESGDSDYGGSDIELRQAPVIASRSESYEQTLVTHEGVNNAASDSETENTNADEAAQDLSDTDNSALSDASTSKDRSSSKDSSTSNDSANYKALTNDEAFILSQNPKFYTLQVIAASRKASLEAYIKRQPNKDKLRMYRGTREGKSWFVVVEGVYSTRDLAMRARGMLPKEQAKAGPWPRLFSSIQEEIETFRRL